MKSWAYCAVVVSMLAAAACGKSPATTGTTTGDNSGGTGGAAVTTGSNTTGSNTTGSNTTGSNTTGSNTTGAGTTGAGGGMGCAAKGQDFMIPDCNTCVAANCCAEQTACDTGTDCDKTFACLGNCASGDMACVKACGMASQQGATDHDALITCLQGSCQMECTQGGKICDSGLATPKKPECGDCLGMSCCTEFDACTADATCKACLLNQMGAGCMTNMLAMAANACANAKCAMQCAP